MTFDLNNNVILVTGANRGIGKAILEEALQRGASKAYAAVRSIDSAEQFLSEYRERVVPIRLDLDDPGSIDAAANAANDVNIVVNNAGVMKVKSALDEAAVETLQFEMHANVYGLIRVAQAFAPVLKAAGGGVFAQINSVTSVKTFADRATYCASKAAAYAITQGLRVLLRAQGTHVVSVHPGPIQTDMGDAAGFGDLASSPSLVANALFDAIRDERFHAWAGPRGEKVGAAYQSFAESVVEADL